MSKIKVIEKPSKFFVNNLEEAYSLGYFSSGVSREKLLDVVIKKYPYLWVHNTKHQGTIYSGIFYNGRHICGISGLSKIPEFTLYEKDTNKVLCRSWKKILLMLKGEGYEIMENDLR